MRISMLAAAVVLAGAALPAGAQEPAPPTAPAPGASVQTPQRWSLEPVSDGFIRLDRKTGQIAHCTPAGASWTCRAVPEERAALEGLTKEVARLREQVAALKTEVAALRAPSPKRAPPPAPTSGDIRLKMPTEQDIARAKAYLAGTWRRLVEMIVSFQKDVLRDG